MKRFAALLLVLAFTLSLAACGGGAGLEGFMANHKAAIDRQDEDGSFVHMTEYVCEGNYALVADDFITYIKSGAEEGSVLYLLDPAEKRGIAIPVEDEKISSETDFLEYNFEPYRALGAKKTGGGKIAGRATDIFLLEQDGALIKFWVDKKSGITLKRAMVNDAGEEVREPIVEFPEIGDAPYCFEVTGIQVGGVTPADMVNLDEYTILSLDSLMGDPFGGLFGDPFGAAFYDAFGSAFGNSFGDAFGGMLGDALGGALGGILGGAFNALDALGSRIENALGRIFR